MYYTQVTQHNTYCIINLSYCPCSPYCPLLPTFERRIERILWYIFIHTREWCAPCVPHICVSLCVCVYWDLNFFILFHGAFTICYVSVSETALAWIEKDRKTRRKGRIEWIVMKRNETRTSQNEINNIRGPNIACTICLANVLLHVFSRSWIGIVATNTRTRTQCMCVLWTKANEHLHSSTHNNQDEKTTTTTFQMLYEPSECSYCVAISVKPMGMIGALNRIERSNKPNEYVSFGSVGCARERFGCVWLSSACCHSRKKKLSICVLHRYGIEWTWTVLAMPVHCANV